MTTREMAERLADIVHGWNAGDGTIADALERGLVEIWVSHGQPTPDPLAGENPGQTATAPTADESEAIAQLEPAIDIMAALREALESIKNEPPNRERPRCPDAR